MSKLITNCLSNVKEFIITLLIVNLCFCEAVIAGTPFTSDESQALIVHGAPSITGRGSTSSSLVAGGKKKYNAPKTTSPQRTNSGWLSVKKTDKNRDLVVSKASQKPPEFLQFPQRPNELEVFKIFQETEFDAFAAKERLIDNYDKYVQSLEEYEVKSGFQKRWPSYMKYFGLICPDSWKFKVLKREIENSDQKWNDFLETITPKKLNEYLETLTPDSSSTNNTGLRGKPSLQPESNEGFLSLLELLPDKKEDFAEKKAKVFSITNDLVDITMGVHSGLNMGLELDPVMSKTLGEPIDFSQYFRYPESQQPRCSTFITDLDKQVTLAVEKNKNSISKFENYESDFLKDVNKASVQGDLKLLLLVDKYKNTKTLERLFDLWTEYLKENPQVANRFYGEIKTGRGLLNNLEALQVYSKSVKEKNLKLKDEQLFLELSKQEIDKAKAISKVFSSIAIEKFAEYEVSQIPEDGLSRQKRRLLALLIHCFNPGGNLPVNVGMERKFPTGFLNLVLEGELTSRLNFLLSLKMYTHCQGLIPGLD